MRARGARTLAVALPPAEAVAASFSLRARFFSLRLSFSFLPPAAFFSPSAAGAAAFGFGAAGAGSSAGLGGAAAFSAFFSSRAILAAPAFALRASLCEGSEPEASVQEGPRSQRADGKRGQDARAPRPPPRPCARPRSCCRAAGRRSAAGRRRRPAGSRRGTPGSGRDCACAPVGPAVVARGGAPGVSDQVAQGPQKGSGHAPGGGRTLDVRCVWAMSSFLSSLVGHSTHSRHEASAARSVSVGKGYSGASGTSASGTGMGAARAGAQEKGVDHRQPAHRREADVQCARPGRTVVGRASVRGRVRAVVVLALLALRTVVRTRLAVVTWSSRRHRRNARVSIIEADASSGPARAARTVVAVVAVAAGVAVVRLAVRLAANLVLAAERELVLDRLEARLLVGLLAVALLGQALEHGSCVG